MKFFKTILLYPVVVFTAIFYPTTIFDIVDIPRDYGKWVASEQKEFFIITYPEKEKGNVIINTYKDYFIVAPLKKDSILSSEVHLVKQDAVRIKEKKIGPLKVQD